LDIFQHLRHLWPDFESLLAGNTNGLSALFWCFLIAIFVVCLLQVLRHRLSFSRRLKKLKQLIADQDKKILAANRRATVDNAYNLDKKLIGPLWREFDESLVLSSDKTLLFNTLDADHFFNSKSLAPGLTGSRLLAAAPSFLVAIGVLGTFVGLTVGLVPLQIQGTADSAKLVDGIQVLIQGAAVAFMTSVWGVALSLVLNFIEKYVESGVLSRIVEVQHSIDYLYPRLAAEQTLVTIAQHSSDSSSALQELHERIGASLQESISGLSESVQTALADTLNQIMKPAIESLVNNASQQSSGALSALIEQFSQAIGDSGRTQGKQLQQATTSMSNAVAQMGAQFSQFSNKLAEQEQNQKALAGSQSIQMAEHLARLNETTTQNQSAIEASAANLLQQFTQTTTEQLKQADQREEERQQKLQQQVTAIADTLSSSTERQLAEIERREASRRAIQEQQSLAMEENAAKLLQQFTQSTAEQLQQSSLREEERQQKLQQQVITIADTLGESTERQLAEIDRREAVQRARQEEHATKQQAMLDALAISTQQTQQHSLAMARQHKALIDGLERTLNSVTTSSKHMENSANQLGMLSSNIERASDTLGSHMNDVAVQLTAAGEHNTELASQIRTQSEALTALQDSIRESIDTYASAAKLSSEGLGAMKQQQDDWLNTIRGQFEQLSDSLKERVLEVEQQASTWLDAYSSSVNRQVEDRMKTWNEESLKYAHAMQKVVNNMSTILDELESR